MQNWLTRIQLTGAIALVSTGAAATESDFTQFEKKIRPVLVRNCYECHSTDAEKIKGGLLLDSKTGWLAGGDSGAVIIPDKPEESPLLQSIAYHKDFPEMPPKERLPESVVSDFRQWIASGAPDPRIGKEALPDAAAGEIDLDEGRKFWAFQSGKTIAPPETSGSEWPLNGIDRFIHARHIENELTPSPDAEPAVLTRRLYFDLIGLPPSPEELEAHVEAIERDRDEALQGIANRLMERPAFGEKWARHWLDLARYADSNGGDINLTHPNAWRYRNYVIDAFNTDKPYDRFIREQIAGDLLPFDTDEQRAEQLIASGFLIMGCKMLSERDKEKMHLDVADEQVDTVGRTFLGLTLGCARCHDHKFDPVPTADYYAMAGIFRSTHTAYGIRMGNVNVSGWIERDLPVPAEKGAEMARYRKTKKDLESKIESIEEQIIELKKLVSTSEADLPGILVDDSEAEVTGTWKASTVSKNYIGTGYIHDNKMEKGALSVTWRAKIPADGKYEVRVAYPGNSGRDDQVPFTVRYPGGEKTHTVNQTTSAPIGGLWEILGRYPFKQGQVAEVTLSNRNTTGYVIADAVQFISEADLEKAKLKPESPDRTRLTAAEKKLQILKSDSKALEKGTPDIPRAMAAQDRAPEEVGDLNIRIRGEVRNLGPVAARNFIQVVNRTDRAPPSIAANESGRRELAEWLADPENPLTARVIVNRLWQHLFGEGLVRTVDNFGSLGDRPSHPDLLDWLANDLVKNGWSLKHTIRQIVLSRTWQQSVSEPPESDPENRLLASQNRRSLSAEAIRDSLLAVSGEFDEAPAESSVSHLGDQAISNSAKQDGSTQTDGHRKRSIFLPLVRNDMPPFLETFDMANPDMVTGRRATTTVPGQALLMLNSPLVSDLATSTVESITEKLEATEGRFDTDSAIRALYRRVLSRTPTRYESSGARAYLAELEAEESKTESEALASLAQVLFASTEFRYLD